MNFLKGAADFVKGAVEGGKNTLERVTGKDIEGDEDLPQEPPAEEAGENEDAGFEDVMKQIKELGADPDDPLVPGSLTPAPPPPEPDIAEVAAAADALAQA